MSAEKRALDDLDALFRAVPAKAVSASRPAKKLRSFGTAATSPSHLTAAKGRHTATTPAGNAEGSGNSARAGVFGRLRDDAGW